MLDGYPGAHCDDRHHATGASARNVALARQAGVPFAPTGIRGPSVEEPSPAQRPRLFRSIGAVVAGHATDLWGVAAVTLGILAALAFYAGSLGPAGRGARHVVGDVLGWGRFLVPLALVAVGVRLLMGRAEDRDERGATREPARAVVGATLTLVAVTGLAALAGGSPPLRAPAGELADAGGWVGAAIGNPLGSGLGGFGAATVLVAVVVAALVLFTGVSVRTAAGGVVSAARWAGSVASGGPGRKDDSGVVESDDEPTDPFGRTVSSGRDAVDDSGGTEDAASVTDPAGPGGLSPNPRTLTHWTRTPRPRTATGSPRTSRRPPPPRSSCASGPHAGSGAFHRRSC